MNRQTLWRPFAYTVLLFAILLPAAINLPASQANAEDRSDGQTVTSGTIEGTVIYQADPERAWRYGRYYIKDQKSGHLAEAVVGLHGIKLGNFGARQKPAITTIDQKNFRFVPETIAIRAGDRVKFTNSDPQVHNVRTNDGQPFAVNTAPGAEYTRAFPQAGGVRRPIQLGCSYHSNMAAWVFVFDHPFYQVTAADGRFRLAGIPAGEYQVRMAHPAGRLSWSKRITVNAGQTLDLDIHVSPDDLRETKK